MFTRSACLEVERISLAGQLPDQFLSLVFVTSSKTLKIESTRYHHHHFTISPASIQSWEACISFLPLTGEEKLSEEYTQESISSALKDTD